MVANRIQSAIQNDRLAEAIAAYLQADEEQEPRPRHEWLARYPELAAELAEFFPGEDQLDGLLKPQSVGSTSALRITERPPAITPAGASEVQSDGRTRSIGDYELLEEIARGGMGVVYRARQM